MALPQLNIILSTLQYTRDPSDIPVQDGIASLRETLRIQPLSPVWTGDDRSAACPQSPLAARSSSALGSGASSSAPSMLAAPFQPDARPADAPPRPPPQPSLPAIICHQRCAFPADSFPMNELSQKGASQRCGYAMISNAVFRCRDVAQFGSALRSGRRSRRFKSCHPDQEHYGPDGGAIRPVLFMRDTNLQIVRGRSGNKRREHEPLKGIARAQRMFFGKILAHIAMA